MSVKSSVIRLNKSILRSSITIAIAGCFSSLANATEFKILYESDADTTTNEMVVNSFNSFNDLINYNFTATIVDVDISASYSSTGFAYDGSKYHILYEADIDTTTNEMVVNSFDSFNDLINYNYTATIVDVDISAGYSSTGLTYDGSKYHILYEADIDTTTNEMVVNSFDSFNDLINYNYTATIVDVDISAGYSSTGLTYDSSIWHILYEADVDTTTNEMVVNSFNSFSDLINYNYTATIVDVDISAAYSSTGFNAMVAAPPPPPGGVPEPSILALMGAGLFGLSIFRRKVRS